MCWGCAACLTESAIEYCIPRPGLCAQRVWAGGGGACSASDLAGS